MISYELCKELKEAGFPQPIPAVKGAYQVLSEDRRDTAVYEPTLSELIEACGEGLGDLTRSHSGWATNVENVLRNPQTEGSTPEEAVARLWLALNKKA